MMKRNPVSEFEDVSLDTPCNVSSSPYNPRGTSQYIHDIDLLSKFRKTNDGCFSLFPVGGYSTEDFAPVKMWLCLTFPNLSRNKK